MFAPQPFDPITVARCHGTPLASSAQADRHVLPGARLLSGLTDQATNRRRRASASASGSGSGSGTSRSAQPTARVIWVSSVTRAGSPSSSRGPAGPYRATISATVRNSVGLPRASPYARPNRLPEALLIGRSPHRLGAVDGLADDVGVPGMVGRL